MTEHAFDVDPNMADVLSLVADKVLEGRPDLVDAYIRSGGYIEPVEGGFQLYIGGEPVALVSDEAVQIGLQLFAVNHPN